MTAAPLEDNNNYFIDDYNNYFILLISNIAFSPLVYYFNQSRLTKIVTNRIKN